MSFKMNNSLGLSISRTNFQKICRTCLIEKNNLQAIFNTIKLLKECTSIQIGMEDDLPKSICLECISKLNNAFEFRKQCEVSQKILLQLNEFEETSVKFENNESNLQSCEILENNEIDIKSEDYYNINEHISDTCDGISDVFSVMKIKPFDNKNEFIKTISNENKSILNVSKQNDINLKSVNTYSVKNYLTCGFYNQTLIERLKPDNRDSIREDKINRDVPHNNKSTAVLRKNKRNKKSSRQNIKLKTDQNDCPIKNDLSCLQCKKTFVLEVDLEIHMFKHQKFDVFICPKCSKSFKNEHNLKQHFNTHMVDKPYKCNMCNKSYAKCCDRNRHLRIHTGEKPYICSSCGKRYPDSSKLSEHMKYHIGIKNFVCTVCSKSFMFPSKLRSHMRVHTGEKPYLCTECGESFSHSVSLKLHKLKHTGERPYSCTDCNKNFLLNKHLKVHMRSHTGEKPYICKICEMSFARSDSLVIHNRSHTGERPYCCDICKKSFKSSKDLSQHKRTHNKAKCNC